MSVNITVEPSNTTLVGAYIDQGNILEVEVTVGAGELPPRLSSIIEFRPVGNVSPGGAIGLSEIVFHEYTEYLGSNVYLFKFDVSSRVQAYFNNLELFPGLNLPSPGVNDKYGIDYRVTATEWRATGPDDTYEQDGNDVTGSITVSNAYRPLQQDQNLSIFDASVSNPSRFFTNKPLTTYTDYNANEWLLVHDAEGRYFVTCKYYNSSGLITTRQWYITGTTIGSNNTGKLGMVAVGPANIDATGAGGRFLSGGTFPMQANGVTHYTILVQDADPAEFTEERTYRINTCPVQYRIHFVNQLGGVDSLLVRRSKSNIFSSEVINYSIPKTSANTSQTSGVQVLQKVGKPGISFVIGMLSEEEFLWLQELAISPAVRLEKDGQYIPIFITQADFEAEDQPDGFYKLTVTAEYSNVLNGLKN
jgi:hypothetical protein